MRVVLKEDDLVVADDVLSPRAFDMLRKDVANARYRSVHSGAWDKAWRPWDGRPLRGGGFYYDPSRVFGEEGATYPTGSSADALVDAVRKMAETFPDVAGVERLDWAALYLCPWLYPVGSALSLHRDGDRYTGAFTYFVHSRWSSGWGGELIAPTARTDHEPSPAAAPSPEAGEEEWMVQDAADDPADLGLGTCILPKPNRLVLLGPERPHRIARVDGNAGARMRASIAGFFLRRP